jgi:hypothetical protein
MAVISRNSDIPATDGNGTTALSARDEKGRLLPGSIINPNGRPKGRANDSTLAAREIMRKNAKKYVRGLEKQTKSKNQFVAHAAFRALLLGGLAAADADERNNPPPPSDSDWMNWAQPEEIEAIHAIMQLCVERRTNGESPYNFVQGPAQQVIDVTPTEVTPEPETAVNEHDELVIDIPGESQ